MSIYLILLLVTLCLCYVIDLSGWTEFWKPKAQAWIKDKTGVFVRDLKPFDCSSCAVFWVGLIVCLCYGQLGWVQLAYVCGLSFFSVVFTQALGLLRELVQGLLNCFGKLIDLII